MKLLLFSDIHCNTRLSKELVKKSAEVDIVIGAGDFATVRRGIEKSIDILREIEKPCVLVPGNNESLGELEAACQGWASAVILHGTKVKIKGLTFFGIGGGIPVTPFGAWSYDFTEAEADQMLQNAPEKAIIISHSPPKGAVDVSSTGQSLGSMALRGAIADKCPPLFICGHIHESAGKTAKIGETLVVNAGPKGMVVEMKGDKWVLLL